MKELLHSLGVSGQSLLGSIYLAPIFTGRPESSTQLPHSHHHYFPQLCIHKDCPICKKNLAKRLKAEEARYLAAAKKKKEYLNRCKTYMKNFRKASKEAANGKGQGK